MDPLRLFLCGDVMTGRGIDQILQRPGDPAIHEGYLQSAADYVALTEQTGEPVPRRVADSYVWGDALAELERFRPDLRIVNLETAVTASGDWLPKGINYRMNPANVGCLTAAAIDCCGLANNHVLDWGEAGLIQTLQTLERAGIRTAGAGLERAAAQAPAELPVAGRGRVLVVAVGMASSGVPPDWAAGERRPGVNFLSDLSRRSAVLLARRIEAARRPGDLVVLSIHWSPNWGYGIAEEETRFAHDLVDAAAVDVVHGHSSHHPKAIEVYRNRLVLYGCGDFINDYEGIGGHESFHPHLRLMVLATIEANTGRLLRLELAPMESKRLRLGRAGAADTAWLCGALDREGRRFGAAARVTAGNRIELDWGPRNRS